MPSALENIAIEFSLATAAEGKMVAALVRNFGDGFKIRRAAVYKKKKIILRLPQVDIPQTQRRFSFELDINLVEVAEFGGGPSG